MINFNSKESFYQVGLLWKTTGAQGTSQSTKVQLKVMLLLSAKNLKTIYLCGESCYSSFPKKERNSVACLLENALT